MGAPSKPINEVATKAAKANIQARKDSEEQVDNMAKLYPVPAPKMILNDEEQEIFNDFVKLNPNFSEGDSTSLTMLTKYLYKYSTLAFELDVLYTDDALDERCISVERRMVAIDKQIVQHMTKLRLTLSDRLQMANDIAKGLVDEAKFKQIKNGNQVQKNNPLLDYMEVADNAK